eukprot:50577-Pyramimonas_sp.AAC.1
MSSKGSASVLQLCFKCSSSVGQGSCVAHGMMKPMPTRSPPVWASASVAQVWTSVVRVPFARIPTAVQIKCGSCVAPEIQALVKSNSSLVQVRFKSNSGTPQVRPTCSTSVAK